MEWVKQASGIVSMPPGRWVHDECCTTSLSIVPPGSSTCNPGVPYQALLLSLQGSPTHPNIMSGVVEPSSTMPYGPPVSGSTAAVPPSRPQMLRVCSVHRRLWLLPRLWVRRRSLAWTQRSPPTSWPCHQQSWVRPAMRLMQYIFMGPCLLRPHAMSIALTHAATQ